MYVLQKGEGRGLAVETLWAFCRARRALSSLQPGTGMVAEVEEIRLAMAAKEKSV